MSNSEYTYSKNIDPIQAVVISENKNTNDWGAILKAVNPLGTIAEMYTKTLMYKVEIKRLDAEMERVKLQSAVTMKAIDATLALHMEELIQRRISMLSVFQTFQTQLEHLHIERKMMLETLAHFTSKIIENGVSIEEKKIYKELTFLVMSQLPQLNDKANLALSELVKTIPVVNIKQIR